MSEVLTEIGNEIVWVIRNEITSLDMLGLGFTLEVNRDMRLNRWVLRNPKMQLRVDPWVRVYLSRKKWDGEWSVEVELKVDGLEGMVNVANWVKDI